MIKGARMHTKLSLFLVTALATTALTARANAKTTVDLEKGQGSSVGTSFDATADITCADGSAGNVFAVGTINASDSITKSTGSPRTMTDGVFIDVAEYFN